MIYIDQVRTLVPRARDLVEGLSASQVNWHPVAGSWSIAECIAHLNTTNLLYTAELQKSFGVARQLGQIASEGEPELGFLERWFATKLEPPYRLKFSAPKQFEPVSKHYERDELLAHWVSIHQQLLTVADENRDLDWKKTRVASPVVPWLKMTALGAFAIIGAHGRRHLWQAEQIRVKLRG